MEGLKRGARPIASRRRTLSPMRQTAEVFIRAISWAPGPSVCAALWTHMRFPSVAGLQCAQFTKARKNLHLKTSWKILTQRGIPRSSSSGVKKIALSRFPSGRKLGSRAGTFGSIGM